MNTFKLLCVVFVFCASKFTAQTDTNNVNHPTISYVKSVYRATQSNQSTSDNFKVTPEISIGLKPSGNATKIFVKTLDLNTNNTVFEVNYILSSAPVLNQAGKIIFENVGGELHINTDTVLDLKPLIYQIYTQDSQSNSSIYFTVIQ